MSHRDRAPVVVVGGGVAGAAAAFSLRDLGYDGILLLISDESHLPYRRTPLASEYLRGTASAGDLVVASGEAYRRAAIDLRLGARVTALDRERRTLTVRGHGRIAYDQAVLATGADPDISLPGPPAYVLRTLADADRLREKVRSGDRVVIVGLGSTGAAIAASLCAQGVHVIGIDASLPTERPAGGMAGESCGRLLRDGVELRLGTWIVALEGGGHAEAARTAAGERIEGDVVVIATGWLPATALTGGAAGVATSPGAGLDAREPDPAVHLAGDVARAPCRGRMTEEAAVQSAAAAAARVVGRLPRRDERSRALSARPPFVPARSGSRRPPG